MVIALINTIQDSNRESDPEAALTALWGEDLPMQHWAVHKRRNRLAHVPSTCMRN